MATFKERKLELLKQEKARRAALPNLLEICFPQQKAFIKSKSTRKALFVARRSGKSFAIAVYLVMAALMNPKVKVLYIGLTKLTAENTMWTHAIQVICETYQIQHFYNKITKTISFTNGSIIRLTGADVSETEMERFLGGKYYLVAVDECQSFRQDLRSLINDKLAPAVSDYASTPGGSVIIMAGTPGNRMGDHYWYQVTKTEGMREPGWEVHHWDVLENPNMKSEILAIWEDMRVREGEHYQESSTFKQQWLCQWVIEDNAKVYQFSELKNLLMDKMPLDEVPHPSEARKLQLQAELKIIKSLNAIEDQWYYILGCDLGYEDDCAWVIGAFNKHDYHFYIVNSFSQNHITVKAFADISAELLDKYKFRSMVIDTGGGGKMIAATLNQVYSLPFKAADKSGEKEAIIARMNSDFQTEHIKLIGSSNKQLIKEWNELIVDKKKQAQGLFKEAERYKNHLADAALYAYREARHYRAKPKEPVMDDMAQRLINRRKQSQPLFQSWQEQRDQEMENERIIATYRETKDDRSFGRDKK